MGYITAVALFNLCHKSSNLKMTKTSRLKYLPFNQSGGFYRTQRFAASLTLCDRTTPCMINFSNLLERTALTTLLATRLATRLTRKQKIWSDNLLRKGKKWMSFSLFLPFSPLCLEKRATSWVAVLWLPALFHPNVP